MTIARITELDRRTTQSGKANNGLWLLEFERQKPLRARSADRLERFGRHEHAGQDHFKTKEEAIAFCEKKGLQYHLIAAAPVTMKIQAYADNFR